MTFLVVLAVLVVVIASIALYVRSLDGDQKKKIK
jgi:hypothetical protein